MAVVAGVDVAKSSLDVSVSEGPVLQFDNTAKGITKLLKHLTKQEATLAVCESTGGYERLLVNRLRKAEIGVRVANPSRVRAFAKACGYEAKTDPRDAQVLSRYGQVFPESHTPVPEPEREELQDLLRRCRQLVEQRVQEVNRLDKGASAAVVESTKRHIAWLDAEIAQLYKEYQWTRSTSGQGVPGRVAGQYPLGPAGSAVPDRPRCGTAHCGHIGGISARTGPVGQQGPDLPGGTGTLVQGQRPQAGAESDPRRPGHSAQSPLPLCLLGDSSRGRVTPFLPKPAAARETWQRVINDNKECLLR